MSHLSTLIGRVRRCEMAGCPESTECGAGEFIEAAMRDKLVNIAEYMTYSHDYSQKEASEAVELLTEFGMGDMVCNPQAITNYLKACSAKGAVLNELGVTA